MLFDPYGYDLSHQQPQPPYDALAADALLEVPSKARDVLWRGLIDAVENTLSLWERAPSGAKREPPVFLVQHTGKRRFDEAMLRAQTLAGWHRLMGLELRVAAQALEALIQHDTPDHREMLAEQCARVGQLYAEMRRRANEWVARALLTWELRLLRYRDSAAVGPLVYD